MDWTEGRKKSFITSVLRSGYRRWPPKYETLKEAQAGKKENAKTKRIAMHYTCNSCKEDFPAKEVQVDHIEPVVDSKQGFKTWDVFIDRLYCDKDNLQVLCKSCHSSKTLTEKKERTGASKKPKTSRKR
jgi:5-methylcytosine-specific restriction endonuclease McrA